MIRAIIAGIIVAVLLGWLGVFVVIRRMSFIGDGIAHSSLAGVAMALLFSWSPMLTAILFAIFIASLIYFLEKKTKINSDVAIAIMFTGGMAIGIIMLHFYQGYQPELISYLFGNILTINNYDLGSIIVFGFLILIILVSSHRKIFFSTFDSTGAYLSGIKIWFYDLMLYIMTAVTIVLSIKLIGIILVSALLVIPSAIAKPFSKSFQVFTVLTIINSIFIVLSGLILSYYLDLPSGAVIVLFGIFVFSLTNFMKIYKKSFYF